jgi:hypothetical protein
MDQKNCWEVVYETRFLCQQEEEVGFLATCDVTWVFLYTPQSKRAS